MEKRNWRSRSGTGQKRDWKTSKERLRENLFVSRVAQLICEKITYPEIEEVESLEATQRGEGGFGSTGGVKNLGM